MRGTRILRWSSALLLILIGCLLASAKPSGRLKHACINNYIFYSLSNFPLSTFFQLDTASLTRSTTTSRKVAAKRTVRTPRERRKPDLKSRQKLLKARTHLSAQQQLHQPHQLEAATLLPLLRRRPRPPPPLLHPRPGASAADRDANSSAPPLTQRRSPAPGRSSPARTSASGGRSTELARIEFLVATIIVPVCKTIKGRLRRYLST